jgi:two-component system response regulator FixJ
MACARKEACATRGKGSSVSETDKAGTVVFIVDDDDDVRDGFTRLIRSAGMKALAYSSAERFLLELDVSRGGCLLLDLTMPGMTGQLALTRLRQMGSQLPVIVVSARDDEMMRAVVRELGAKMFLRKPVDDQALLDAIQWAAASPLDVGSA